MSTLHIDGVDVTHKQVVGLVAASVARTLAGMALILWVLTLVPQRPDANIILPILLVVAGVGVYGWFFAHQVKKVTHAAHPAVRSVEALVLVATMFLAVFASIYVMISSQSPGSFTESLDHFTAYYFSLTVLATVGFGDITPISDGARLACMVQMALDIAFIGATVKILGGTASRAMRDRAKRAAEQEASA
ncbi:MAG: hypothetical protein F2840_06300 [Actinobacteria bacterium]|jgi:hypothetical protein|uniref:Unannotated protein n=1 Tax=freshwater metagenome TaxID=449393 RepID=A0A6J7JRT6_9ZZZZ|nr:hypothetical protein [Actinomycetota bacterium]